MWTFTHTDYNFWQQFQLSDYRINFKVRKNEVHLRTLRVII